MSIKFDPKLIRQDFPIFEMKHGLQSLIYLDNAATTQKPLSVIQAISQYYKQQNANTHSLHTLAIKLTHQIEKTRQKIANFVNFQEAKGVVFTSSATESINLVAHSFAADYLQSGEEIIISRQEHHANILPWRQLAKDLNLKVKVWEMEEDNTLSLSNLKKILSPATKLLAVSAMSNVIGGINNLENVLNFCKQNKIISVVDGTQVLQHLDIDLQKLACDFFVFSGHKIFGPTGIGVIVISKDHWQNIKPYQLGGEMVNLVTDNEIQFQDMPYLLEAGTKNFAGIIGLDQAIDYLLNLREKYSESLFNYELQLSSYTKSKLLNLPGINLIQHPQQLGIFSFQFTNKDSLDIATLLNSQGIAVRVGGHCAQPLLQKLGQDSLIRISTSFYNTFEEIDFCTQALEKILNSLK